MSPKILVVDDDPSSVRIVSAFLKMQHYDVATAVDGLDALVKIKEYKPDVVVLDIMMPEINGYDVCYQLRFNKDFEKIPIILLTVRDQEMGEEIGKRVNIEYIQKPFQKEVLLEKVKRFLNMKST